MIPFDFSCFSDAATMLDSSSVSLAVIDIRIGTIVYITQNLCNILGRQHTDLLGNTWKDIVLISGSPAAMANSFAFPDEQASHVYCEKKYLRPDGAILWLGLTLLRSPDITKRNFYIIIVNNLTLNKRTREILDSRTRDLEETQDAIFNSMAILSEFRDRETGEHITRTRRYVHLILDKIPSGLPFSRKATTLIANSAVLHDIGKVGIPDHILLKPGKLTSAEFEIMKTHTTLGAHAILRTQRTLENGTFLMFAKEIAKFHHERWDGRGYPEGLKGDQIPLTARVMALADVYDAVRSERPYKEPFSHEKAIQIILEGRGSQFDPQLTDVFLANQAEIQRIASTAKDELDREYDCLEQVE